jgi:hypothetical protein
VLLNVDWRTLPAKSRVRRLGRLQTVVSSRRYFDGYKYRPTHEDLGLSSYFSHALPFLSRTKPYGTCSFAAMDIGMYKWASWLEGTRASRLVNFVLVLRCAACVFQEKARRHKERDDLETAKIDAEKADAESLSKARKEEERIPVRQNWKPVSIEVTGGVNGLPDLAGVNGLSGAEAGGPLDKASGPGLDSKGGKDGERKDEYGVKASEESDDEPLIRRRVDRKRKATVYEETSGDEQEEKNAGAAGDLKGKRVLDGREKRGEAEGIRGGPEGRKKARVSYIELLSSDKETMEEERPTQSETKRRERVAKEGRSGPDARAEVLPGRAKEKHKLLAEVLSRAEVVSVDRVPLGDTDTCEPPFLVPAKGVNKPFVREPGPSEAGPSEPEGVGPSKAAEVRGKTTAGEDSHRPAGEGSHQHADEAGPSSANGDVPAGDGAQLPDTIFFDFDEVRKEADVQVGQIWALYDEVDGMPRFYGRVDSVERNPFLVDITWLEATDEEREAFYARDALLRDHFISPGVGKFVWGSSTQFDAINIFAYQQMAALPSEKGAQLFPRCGEVWAMFRLEKQSKGDRKSTQLSYDVVEVVGAEGGYVITKLARLPQHKSLFQPIKGLNGKPFRVSVKPAVSGGWLEETSCFLENTIVRAVWFSRDRLRSWRLGLYCIARVDEFFHSEGHRSLTYPVFLSD